MSPQVAEPLGAAASFIIIAWIVKISLAHRRWVRAAQIQSDLQSKLLDKFTSTNELLEYMRCDSGRQLLDPVVSASERSSPYSRILTSVQAGAVLAALGVGLYLVRGEVSQPTELTIAGGLALALGVGFLVSAGISYMLSRSWGLINGHKELESLGNGS